MEKIDVIIPLLKNGSKHNDLELRYALRSIEKYLTNYRDIYIVADYQPEWLQGVTIVYLGDSLTKTKNIKRKIEACLDISDISNEVLFTNDDIFLLKGMDATKYPYYYSTTAQQKIADRDNRDIYKRIMLDTDRVLCESGVEDFKYFDIHKPIRYDRIMFNHIMSNYDWNNRYGYLIKSLYGNHINADLIDVHDNVFDFPIKESKELVNLNNHDCFSLHSKAIDKTMIDILECLYPNKSKYEL